MMPSRSLARFRSIAALGLCLGWVTLDGPSPGSLHAAEPTSPAGTNNSPTLPAPSDPENTNTTEIISTNAPTGSNTTSSANASVSVSPTVTPSTNQVSTATNSANTGPTFATALDYPSFRIISDRNIFNPNRTSRSSRGGRNGGGSEPKPVRIESFSLVGTMSYGSNQMAFFDSSTPRYRKAIKNGDSIADHKVVSVTVQGVRLEKEGKQFEMTMGSQMKREDDAPWELKLAATSVPRTSASSSTSDSSSGADNDVLKRLLQKREQELNK